MVHVHYLVTPGVAAHVDPALQRIIWHWIDNLPIVRKRPAAIQLSRSCLRGLPAQWIRLRQTDECYQSEQTILFPSPVELLLMAVFEKPHPVICLAEEFEEDE